jgi:hypothetical protein
LEDEQIPPELASLLAEGKMDFAAWRPQTTSPADLPWCKFQGVVFLAVIA